MLITEMDLGQQEKDSPMINFWVEIGEGHNGLQLELPFDKVHIPSWVKPEVFVEYIFAGCEVGELIEGDKWREKDQIEVSCPEDLIANEDYIEGVTSRMYPEVDPKEDEKSYQTLKQGVGEGIKTLADNYKREKEEAAATSAHETAEAEGTVMPDYANSEFNPLCGLGCLLGFGVIVVWIINRLDKVDLTPPTGSEIKAKVFPKSKKNNN